MKRSTLKRLLFASVLYLFLLTVIRSIIPESLSGTLPLLAIPLVSLALILTLDLRHRSIIPTEVETQEERRRIRARDVQSLTKQLEVAGKASAAYFETVLRNRLRDLLAEKVSLETGIEESSIKTTLADGTLGPQLLKDSRTYALLYSRLPSGAAPRLQMLREIIDRIEGWKA